MVGLAYKLIVQQIYEWIDGKPHVVNAKLDYDYYGYSDC